MSNNSSSSGGIGFTGLLTIVFIVLKLTGYIDWAWVWVLCPLWIGAAIAITVVLIVIALSAWAKTVEKKRIAKNPPKYRSKWEQKLEEMKQAQSERNKSNN